MKSSPVKSLAAKRRVFCATQHQLEREQVKPQGDQGVRGFVPGLERRAGCCRATETSNKELVSVARLPFRLPGPHGFAMPRYFFNTRIGDELIVDPDGEELRDPERAWEIARAMVLELLRSEGASQTLLSAVIEVMDDDDEIVLEFPFNEALVELPDENATRH
jgi:hypothetical protein